MKNINSNMFCIKFLQGEIICDINLGQAIWHWYDYKDKKIIFLYSEKIKTKNTAKKKTFDYLFNGNFLSIMMENTDREDFEIVSFHNF